jgi:hypothetical protein
MSSEMLALVEMLESHRVEVEGKDERIAKLEELVKGAFEEGYYDAKKHRPDIQIWDNSFSKFDLEKLKGVV